MTTEKQPPSPQVEGLKVGDLVLTHTGEAGRIDYEDTKHTKRWHVLISPNYGGMYFDFELTKLVPATPSPQSRARGLNNQ